MKCTHKIKTGTALANITKAIRSRGKKIVFTNGCFDIIHPGHIEVLEKARAKGSILIVGINSDSSVRKIKGIKRPIFNQDARAQIIAALGCVDYVVVFNDPTPYALIERLKPNVIVKGGDWETDKIVGKSMVEKVYRVKLVKSYSTSTVIQKILRRYAR